MHQGYSRDLHWISEHAFSKKKNIKIDISIYNIRIMGVQRGEKNK